jgi:O-antigen/teichoic acid export membrane protein
MRKSEMSEDQSSYRQIMKATSVFGGVQVFNIATSIIRSKFIALLLGPLGMGIAGLLTSTTGLISGLTNFGLGTSAVMNVAAANVTGNKTRISIVITVLKRLVWITGILGSLVTLALSPWLSEITFGNRQYTMAFIWISMTLLFTQLSTGQLVVLQGMRKLQYLAKANLAGSSIGLVITIPLYYLYRLDAIVPVIIISSLVSLALSWYFARKVRVETIKVSPIRTLAEGKKMLTMGFMISMSSMISLGASYIVRIYISNSGGIDQAGLYTAGFTIINSYVGLIFTAMGTDYYPRLSAVATNNELCKKTINQQAEIALLIMGPIVMVFLVFIHWVVIVLYSNEFVSINEMLHWAALGLYFKAVSVSIGFILLAKGVSKLFFWNELLSNFNILVLNLLGYHFMGLTGLGISFSIGYLFYLVQIFTLSKRKFEFSFSSSLISIFGIQFLLAICSFMVVKTLRNPYTYIVGVVLLFISMSYSYIELDKRIDVKAVIKRLVNRYSKNQ